MKRILVIFDKAIREDDLECWLRPIKALSKVKGVKPFETSLELYTERMRIESKIQEDVFTVLKPERNPPNRP